MLASSTKSTSTSRRFFLAREFDCSTTWPARQPSSAIRRWLPALASRTCATPYARRSAIVCRSAALSMTMASVLWRRIDSPGHDACRLARDDAGWKLDGAAVFSLDGLPACLRYTAVCDGSWRTQRGHVSGWIGERSVAFVIERAPGGSWTLDGGDVPGLEHCLDLDFGFTPSTNLLQLRR